MAFNALAKHERFLRTPTKVCIRSRVDYDGRGPKNYPLIGFRKPADRKAEDPDKAVDGRSSEPAKADDPEDTKENA